MPTAIAIGNMFGGAASGSIGSGGSPTPPALSGLQFSVDTTNTGSGASASNQFNIKMAAGNTYNYDVDWGDGTTDNITAYNDPLGLHTYAVSGLYTIKITGVMGDLAYAGSNDIVKITDISNWGGSVFTIGDGGAAFAMRGYSGTITAADSPTIVGSLVGYFYQSTIPGGLSGWSMGNATSLQFLVLSNAFYNEDISGWDVSSITTMSSAFAGGGMSTANYDALLISWSAQTVLSGVSLGMGSTKYTIATAGAARATLVGQGWSISDGGGV